MFRYQALIVFHSSGAVTYRAIYLQKTLTNFECRFDTMLSPWQSINAMLSAVDHEAKRAFNAGFLFLSKSLRLKGSTTLIINWLVLFMFTVVLC